MTAKTNLVICTVLTLAMAAASTVSAAGVNLAVDLASAYVFRGVTFNDGLVVQPGAEVSELPLGITLGVWGNVDIGDYDKTLMEGEFSEIDLYGSIDVPLPVELLGLSVGYTEYTYPTGGSEADREVSVTASLNVPLSPSVSVYYGFDGGIEKVLYLEAGLSQEIPVVDNVGVELGATVGYVSPDEGDSGFSHYTASATVSAYCVSASLTYVGQIDDDILPDGPGAYDTDVYGTIGLSGDF